MKGIITHIKSLLIVTGAAGVALLFPRCANVSGGESEAGNARITGMVLTSQGSPAGNVIVQILPSDFDPVKDAPTVGENIETTSVDGVYGFTVKQNRMYTIQAVQMVLRSRALVASVEAKLADTIAPQCTLKSPGAVKVMVPTGADTVFGYMYIPGTTFFAT